MGGGQALTTPADSTVGVALHVLADEVGQGLLVEAGEPGDEHVLGNGLEALDPALGEEGVLRVGLDHLQELLKKK